MIKKGVSSKVSGGLSYAEKAEIKTCPHCGKVISIKTIEKNDGKCNYCKKGISES